MKQKIQPIRYMHETLTKEEFIGFLRGNVIKYVSRSDKKNGIEDLKKAVVYLNWLVEMETKGDITIANEVTGSHENSRKD